MSNEVLASCLRKPPQNLYENALRLTPKKLISSKSFGLYKNPFVSEHAQAFEGVNVSHEVITLILSGSGSITIGRVEEGFEAEV